MLTRLIGWLGALATVVGSVALLPCDDLPDRSRSNASMGSRAAKILLAGTDRGNRP